MIKFFIVLGAFERGSTLNDMSYIGAKPIFKLNNQNININNHAEQI